MAHDVFEYLNTLAAITIGFVGFAGLYIGFKTADKTSRLKILITRNHFVLSFAVVGDCLFPQLLTLVLPSMPSRLLFLQNKVWSLASLIAACVPLLFSVRYPAIRYRATREKMPMHTAVLLVFYFIAALLLLANVYKNSPPLYVFGLSFLQCLNVWTFVYALRSLLDVASNT